MNSNGDKSERQPDNPYRFSIAGHPILGFPIDDQSRCRHYHSALDIVAIKFRCCNHYYPCHACHEEASGHITAKWTKDQSDLKAILCGACGYELSIREYLTGTNQCPSCQALFNPGCSNHHHLYFEM